MKLCVSCHPCVSRAWRQDAWAARRSSEQAAGAPPAGWARKCSFCGALCRELSAGQNRAGLQTGRVEPGALRACPAGSGRAAQSPRAGGHLGRPSPVCPHGVLAVCLRAGSDDVGVDGSNDVSVESRCSGQGMDCSFFCLNFFF